MKVRLELKAGKGTTAGFTIPDAVVEALGGSRKPAVKVTLNGYAYRSSIARMGDRFMLGVSNEVRAKSGVAPGETLDVDIELDTEKREVVVPPDLAAALADDPAAAAAFAKLSYSHQRQHVMAIEALKGAEARARRVDKTLATVRDG